MAKTIKREVPAAGPAQPVWVAGGKTSEEGAIGTIDIAHWQVHEGNHYAVSYVTPQGSLVADDASLDILITTGAFPVNILFQIATGGDGEGYVYEGTTTSNDGTSLAVTNNNRRVVQSASSVAFHTPTVTVVGTELHSEFIPGGTGGNAAGGTTKRETEFILAPNTNYLFRFTNRAGNAKAASIGLAFYEEED